MPQRTIAVDDDGRRLDRVVRAAFPAIPPGAIARAIRTARIRLNGHRCSNGTRVHTGEILTYPAWTASPGVADTRDGGNPPLEPPLEPPPSGQQGVAPAAHFHLLQKTHHWLAINKPAASLTSSGAGVGAHICQLAAQEGWWHHSLSFRPGPVHRLDFATSGVQLFALSATGARFLSAQFAQQNACKIYLALVAGHISTAITIDRALAYDHATHTARVAPATTVRAAQFRRAVTHVHPLAASSGVTLVAIHPQHGRTHQVRAHLAARGHPLVGDRKYGGPRWRGVAQPPYTPPKRGGEIFFLHAAYLAISTQEQPAIAPVDLFAPLPPAASQLLRRATPALGAVSASLRRYIAAACPGCHGIATIKL